MPAPCLDCLTQGHVTPTNGTRCPGHQATEVQRRAHATPTRTHRGTYAWEQQAKQTVKQWRETNGDWCPGWRRDPHPAPDLTADHWIPGDPTVVVVFCRSCNSRKRDIVPTLEDAERLAAGGRGEG